MQTDSKAVTIVQECTDNKICPQSNKIIILPEKETYFLTKMHKFLEHPGENVLY